MKFLSALPICCLLSFFAPDSNAGTYRGTWNNTTFDTSGDLTFVFNITKKRISGTFDADGPVFGAGDPPAIPFDAPLKKDGSATFTTKGTQMGDIKGEFQPNGKLLFTITNIPGGFLTEARINGRVDREIEGFRATYEIDSASGLFAEGKASAHVRKAPIIKSAKKVKTKKATVSTKVTALSFTNIKSASVKANRGAKARLKGKGPYRLEVSKLKKGTTRVTLVFRNGDNKRKTKTIKIVRR